MTLATPAQRQRWNDLLDMDWDDPANDRNTALCHTGGEVPEWWKKQSARYFYYRKVRGFKPSFLVQNHNKEDLVHIRRARRALK